MDTTSYVGISRQAVLIDRMADIAANLANSTTSGYRAERATFASHVVRTAPGESVAFVYAPLRVRDLDPGPVTATGNPLDLAIDGEGYFTIETPQGPRYTRSGHFRLDSEGTIVTADGTALLDDGGGRIVVPPEAGTVAVAPDGMISSGLGPIARLQIVGFPDEQALVREGGSRFRAPVAAIPSSDARLMQGMIEGSNVAPLTEMTRMMETMRAFEGTQRLLEIESEIERRAIERLGSLTA